jgi:1-acyl-sn-glycerol-3-phosphate acyltransferase
LRGGRGVGTAAPTITLDVGPLAVEAAAGGTTYGRIVECEPPIEGEPFRDEFGLDQTLRERLLPAFRFLHDVYWRVDVSGIENLPANGAALLVANHSGAVPFDGAMICTAAELRGGRTVRFLYDRFVENLPPVSSFYRKMGGAVAARENAVRLLRAGHPVLLFPEGVPGVAKPFHERYRLRSFSPGFARLALSLDVPVVPVAVVGAEEIYPLVGRAEGVGKLFGMPYVPLTPFFPMLGLLGALPLPTKWFIRFGKPIYLSGIDVDARFQHARHEALHVRRVIQKMVTRMRRRRQSVFFG